MQAFNKLYVLFLIILCTPSFAEETVGYYIGSFDPPTIGHKAVLEAAMKEHKLAKVYITVNYNTDKDFNASMNERIDMLKMLFKEYGDKVEILREPLEGRPAFAKYLLDKHQEKVLGIFGDDTFEKNYKIFTTDSNTWNFDYIKVARPAVATALESVYIPVVHDLEIDADGTSSSKARELIALGKDPAKAKVLSDDVWKYIQASKLYIPIPVANIKSEEIKFQTLFKEFVTKLATMHPELNLSAIPVPTYKSTQSLSAQKDKLIRSIVTTLKLNLENQITIRKDAELLLKLPYETRPLRSEKKAGIYLGSFDGQSSAQKAVIRESLKQGGLDLLYVGVLGASKKPIKLPLNERMTLMKEMTAEFGDKVAILSIPTLEGSASAVKRLKNEHSAPTLAVFGDNVFDANYERLKGIQGLKFAVVPTGNSSITIKYPSETTVITVVDQKDLLHNPNDASPTSKSCRDTLVDLGGSFKVLLPGTK